MGAEMVNLEVIMLLYLLKQYVDSLRRIHLLLTAQETFFILILDVQGIVTLFDVLLESFVYLHHSTLTCLFLIDGEFLAILAKHITFFKTFACY